MNTLLLEYFAAVSKIAAVRQFRERQQGVDCSQGYLRSTDAGLLFDGPRTLETFFNYQRSAAYQRPVGFTADTIEFEIPAFNDTLVFYCGRSRVQASLVDGHNYHAVISYNGDTATAYLNGAVVNTIKPAKYLAPPAFNIGNATYPPKGPVYFARIYNYAISAEETSALYNNGNPMGYVIPALYKHADEIVELASPEKWAYTGNSRYDSTKKEIYMSHAGQGYALVRPKTILGEYLNKADIVYLIRMNIKGSGSLRLVENESKVLPISTTRITPLSDSEYTKVSALIAWSGSSNSILFRNVNLGNWRIKDIEISVIGCVAEYLPQNLIVGNNGVVSTWLDSAKQLPMNKEDLPPLLETAGGYDLTAEGTPKIIYKL